MVIAAYDFRTNNQMINLIKRIILIFVAYNYFRVIYGSAQIFFLKNPLIYVISLVRVDIVYRSPHLS